MNANELSIFADRAKRVIPYSLQHANFVLSQTRSDLQNFVDAGGDATLAAYLRAAVTSAEAIANEIAEIVNARRIVREAREAELKANPFRFVLNKADGSQIKGGAESKALCYDHVRQLLRDYPNSTAFYTGRHGAIDRPVRIR